MYHLHTLIMLVCVGIFIVVFGAMFYSLYKHRKSVGHAAEHFHENTTVEIIWTVIPFIILIGMAFRRPRGPGDEGHVQSRHDHQDYRLPVEMGVRLSQRWRVHSSAPLSTPREQIDGNAAKDAHYLLEVDQPMVVPVGKRIRLLVTANDVIHSWWVPAFGVKQDAIPGFIRDTWFKADKIGTLIVASVPNCAARTMASCRSWSRWSRRRTTRLGGEEKRHSASRGGRQRQNLHPG